MPPLPLPSSSVLRLRLVLAHTTCLPTRASSISLTTRRYATPTATATSTSTSTSIDQDMGILSFGPPPPKTGSDVKMVKYAGKRKPITPGVRHTIQVQHSHLHPGSPLRDLTLPLRRSGGRNSTGRVVNRFVGGGHKRRLRIVDFMRSEEGDHRVERIEYDPGRSGHIALIRKVVGPSAADTTTPIIKPTSSRISSSLEIPFSSWGPSSSRQLRSASSLSISNPSAKKPEIPKTFGGLSYILAPDGLRTGDIIQSYRSGIPKSLIDSLGDVDVDPSSPQTVENPLSNLSSSSAKASTSTNGFSASTSSSRALGLLRTLTLKPGNVLPLHLCPPGTIIHNISTTPLGKMALCRSAGTFGQVVSHGTGKKEVAPTEITAAEPSALTIDGDESLEIESLSLQGVGGKKLSSKEEKGWTLVKMQSGEVRKLHPECVATVGQVSNKEHQQTQIGKAGRSRWLGRRPSVRGVAMNACDHPHGGGRGKSKGNKHPRSVWGWLTKGKRTRRPKDKDGNKMVVTERPRGKATSNR